MLLDQGPTLMISFYFNYFLKDYTSKYSHQKLGLKIDNFGERHKHSVHNSYVTQSKELTDFKAPFVMIH